MKKFLITTMGLLVMLSCNQKPRSVSSDDAADDDDDDRVELKLKDYQFTDTVGMAHSTIIIEYPVKGEKELVNAIRQYIAEWVGLESDEVELDDGQGVTDYFGNGTMERLKEIAAGYEEEEDDYVNEVYHDWSFSKLYETDDYVTFMGYTELYEGGIHGISYENGVTFFDGGQRFSKEMLRNIDGEKFQKLMRKGLKDFFSKNPDNMTDEELGEELINVEDVYNIPMPDAEPYITEDGVTFIYQPYEISYYAAGKPEFSVPLTKMRPFLTKKALRLLDMDEEDEN